MVIDATARGHGPRLMLLSSEFPPGPGGIGTHAYQLARHLTRLGWGVRVLSPQPYVAPDAAADFNRRQEFAITPLPEREAGAGWGAARLRLIHTAIREHQPALLVASGQRALWTAAAVHAVYRQSWVAVGHGSEFLSVSRAAAWLTRRAVEGAAAVVAVSDYTAGLIRAAALPRRLVVIPNAADGKRFRPGLDASELRRRWALGDARVLLTVGQVGERKAQDVVIRALPRVLAARPDVVYVMVGLPRRQAEYAALAAELGVADRVRFAGLLPDEELPAAYNLADVFVLVSRRAADGDVEGYGIVVQEAALCGAPAVVSRDCGLTEAISEGRTGLSVPPDDPEATAGAILALLDEDTGPAMGRQAREAARAATWAERVVAYDELLRGLLPAVPEVAN
jgi:phosphatidylinositol alpha-1,6-mannosyltransferase